MHTRRRATAHIEEWSAKIPFRITGHVWPAFRVIVVEISDGTHVGRGEGAPVYYLDESVESVVRQIESVVPLIEQGADRRQLQRLMPAGAARNALDCALWDLEAKTSSRSIWEMTNISPKSVTSAFTIGIEESAAMMAARATEAARFPVLKIKLDDKDPIERVSAIKAARPDATLTVDVNQGWSFEQLVEIAPVLARLGVAFIEQPLRRGADHQLEGYRSPIPLCADESCQHLGELERASKLYQIINIKLDKAGGLTEAFLLVQAVRAKGLEPLVCNMWGTSLGMAPGFVLAQVCKYVELDGPLLLRNDRVWGFQFHEGEIGSLDSRLWG